MNDIYMLIVGKDADTDETTIEIVQYEEENRKVINFFTGKESENILSAILSKSKNDEECHNGELVKSIYFSTFSEAKTILDEIQSWAADIGSLTIDDYYDVVGTEGCAADSEYGWTKKSLVEACVLEVEEGEHKGEYILYLPEPRDMQIILKAGKR